MCERKSVKRTLLERNENIAAYLPVVSVNNWSVLPNDHELALLLTR